MKHLFLLLACLPLLLNSCSSESWRTASGSVWGTTYHITYLASNDLTDSIIAVTSAIDGSLSMFNPSSTVSRINRGETTDADTHFVKVYELSRRVSRASSGRFDPTVAPLVDLWGFGRGLENRPTPDSLEIACALSHTGITRTRLYNGKILSDVPGIEFDFSAIAKGYGVDCVADMMLRNGCRNFMIEIGGEVRLCGLNPRGEQWRIQIDAPVAASLPGDSAMTVLSLTDCAIATSGNYRRFRELGADSVVGHTINPLTGYPAQKSFLSATVIAPDCAMADALATALMASPPDSASAILTAFPSAKAILLTPRGKIIQLP